MDNEKKQKLIRIGSLSAAVLVVLMAILWQRCGIRGCPDVETLKGFTPDQASVVMDREGNELTKLYRTKRVVVPLDSLPDYVPQAFVAIEDKEFWDHAGVDWSRVMGAMLANVRAGGVEQGGSTITMQLARNVFPDKLPASQQTLWRKLGEVRVAKEIEDRFEKQEILQMYLNQIYFGEGAWGIQNAAMEYFGKPASELTLAEAATLAALPQAPSRLNPRVNAEGAIARRAVVFDRMVEQEMITREEADSAHEKGVRLVRTSRRPDQHAGYFVDEVRRLLEEQFGELIYTEGYTIHTTVDATMQRVAEEELARQLAAVESGRYGTFRGAEYGAERDGDEEPSYLQGAVVIMAAETGDVLALVGGRNFQESSFNRATLARRQPGSAFKPFVFAAALQAGYSPFDRVQDTPIRMVGSDGRVWAPGNYNGHYAGITTVRDALVHSRNVATVRIAEGVGIGRVAQFAEQMGIPGDIPELPAISLGTYEVTPLALTAAYTGFATLGDRAEPRLITSVEDNDGNVVWTEGIESGQVIDADIAYVLTDMLRDVVDRGTATAVRSLGYRGAVAGKTGTTNDATDLWFVGYTPRLVGTIWVGFDKPATVVRGASGGEVAAPVWARIMTRVRSPLLAGDWTAPPGVERLLVQQSPMGLCVDTMQLDQYGAPSPVPCPDGYASSYDTTTYGSSVSDSLSDDAWWDRLRSRIFGSDEEEAAAAETPMDTFMLGEPVVTDPRAPRPMPLPRPDSIRPPQRDSARAPQRVPQRTNPPPRSNPPTRDTTVKVLGEPAKPPPKPPTDTSSVN